MPIGLGNVNRMPQRPEKGFFGYLMEIPPHHWSKISKWMKGEEPLDFKKTYIALMAIPVLIYGAHYFGFI